MTSEVGPGTFLIASPVLSDPNFARSVVLLCEHNERGSMGLVVNRPTDAKLVDVVSGISVPLPPEERVYYGGPVQPEALLVLHRVAKSITGEQAIAAGMALGGDMQELIQLMVDPREPEDRVRVYAGYAGWGAGQLESELLQGGWITCSADARFVFDIESSEVWAEVLRSLGSEYAYLVNMPLDPRVN